MGAGAASSKAFPTPGVAGSGLGSNAVAANALAWPNSTLRPNRPTESAQALKPMTAAQGQSLSTGQAPQAPFGQTPYNPWGQNRGGSGLLPIYRRPQTLPG